MSKTIETHLQSNEIRIPKKPEFDVTQTAAPCQYFKSSFARSLSFSTNGAPGHNQNFTKSLDFDINFGLTTINDQSSSSQTTTPTSALPIFDSDLMTMSASASKANNNNNIMNLMCNNGIGSSNGGVVKTLWNYNKVQDTKQSSSASSTPTKSMAAAVPSPRKSLDTNDIEVLRLRKECQNLIEENRRLMNLTTSNGFIINGIINGGSGVAGGNYQNVETVILQTQVETLQWQLKQVDSSRQMYRAVMEEVVRYLERCHRSLDALQLGTIGRSKSVLQVSKTNHDSDSSNASSPRTRSSTNLIDVQKIYTKKQQDHMQQPPPMDDVCVPPSPASSYSTFRDFTWRRTPKRTQTLPISTIEVDPEKLAKEAFRLLRTVQNLLNTQEPLLSQSTNALDSLISSTTTSTLTGGGNVNHPNDNYSSVMNTRSTVGFNRKLNMRGSRLSLRSSTDDSVHSTSSSNKTETDDDNGDRPSPPLGHHHHHNSNHIINHRHSANIERIKEMMISSSAEDESGFSSMNSFQEIGLPLINSTMMSVTTGGSGSSAASSTGSVSVSDESTEIRDNTIIPSASTASPSKLLTNNLGIPSSLQQHAPPKPQYEHHSHFANHRRWDSAPVVPPKLKLHTNDDTINRVLWV